MVSRTLLALTLVLVGCGSSSSTSKPAPPPLRDAPTVPATVDPPREPGPAQATQIAVGYGHACARMSDDTMRCWGSNDFGELGAGHLQVTTKQATPAVTGVVEVSAGYGFTCARLRDHTVRCWGNALDGEIGVASPTDPEVNHSITAPTAVPGLTDAVHIASWLKHSCAVRADGAVACWGDNTYGQLGDGRQAPTLGPVAVKGLDGVTQLDVGDFACARRTDGGLRCWGTNVGLTPVAVDVQDVVEVATGAMFACARDRAGAVWCWGQGSSGQLSRAADGPAPNIPAAVPGITGATAVAAGATNACAIVGRQLLCWGAAALNPGFPKDCLRMTANQGHGGAAAQWEFCTAPTAVPGVIEPIAVDTMGGQICALTADHAVLCWGNGVAAPAAVTL